MSEKLKDILTKDVLVELYVKSGETQKQIAEKFNCTPSFICKLLKEYGIKARTSAESREKAKRILPKEVLYQLYVIDKKSVTEIRKQFGLGHATVLNLLRSYGIEVRSRRQGSKEFHKKRVNVNLDFFKNETPELLYIIGLWASDGNLYKGNKLKLTMKDKDVIEWVAKTIGYKNKILFHKIPISNGKYCDTYTICFANDYVADVFRKYGIKENKSLNIEFPNISENLIRHFVRGVFDGDGSVTIGKRSDNGANYQSVSIVSGSYSFITKLSEVIKEQTGIKGNKITKDKRKKSFYQFRISDKSDVIKFAEWLYKDNSFGMSRKKNKFIQLGANI